MRTTTTPHTRAKLLAPVVLLGALLLAASAASFAAKKDKRIAELPERYQTWVASVALLMSDEELAAFLELEQDYQRDAFIERFWRSRDPYPETTRNELKDNWERRLFDVLSIFGSLDEARAEMMMLNGEPAGRLEFRCSGTVYDMEAWFYDGSDRVGYEFWLLFYQRNGLRTYRLWRPDDGIDELIDRSAAADSVIDLWQSLRGCQNGDTIARVLQSLMADPMEFALLEAKLTERTSGPPSEWVATFESYSTDLPDEAVTFAADLDVSFTETYQSRTVVQGTLQVATDAVGTSSLGDHRTYDFQLSGEIMQEDRLFENFRYKFGFPAESLAGGTIPMTFERRLRPGSYTLIVKLEDLGGGGFFRERRDIEVPELDRPAGPRDAESAAIFDAAAATLEPGQTTLELVPPHGDMHTGMVRFDTLTTGDAISEVLFLLDEKTSLRKRRPPWSVDLDLGRVPRRHDLRVVAFDDEGEEVASDEIAINAGVHRFAVRVLEPQSDRLYDSVVPVEVEVAVPEDAAVEKVELYFNEDLAATLFQPPFTQEIRLPQPSAVGYVRAVAYQPDGNSSEDLVFVNAPDLLEEVEVEFVELFTTVLDKQKRPVLDLPEEAFSALEDGVEQKLVRFDVVRDLPIHAGIMLDVSASMEDSLSGTKQAALRFFEEAITPKDRAALITFNDHPYLAAKFSNEISDLSAGLAGIKAERGTSLYDALIFSLYYFNGIKGQRVLLLLSDGKDENSRFAFEDALEYARRTGVAIYAVGLDITGKGSGAARNALTTIAEETGGRSFFISSVDELSAIYAAIQQEIRSRYLLGYQSSNTGGSAQFREVAVEVEGAGLEAKTMSGYYP
jgi:Ca-activated chloride channel family protein